MGKRSIFSSHTRSVYGSLSRQNVSFYGNWPLLCTLQTRIVTLVTYSLTYTDLVCKIPRLMFWFAARYAYDRAATCIRQNWLCLRLCLSSVRVCVSEVWVCAHSTIPDPAASANNNNNTTRTRESNLKHLSLLILLGAFC